MKRVSIKAPRRFLAKDKRFAVSNEKHRAGLEEGRRLFNRVLNEELGNQGLKLPESARDTWIVSQDMGLLRPLWKAANPPRVRRPKRMLIAHDILTLQEYGELLRPRIRELERSPGGLTNDKLEEMMKDPKLPEFPRETELFHTSREVVQGLMGPKDINVFQVRNRKQGKHLATVIHVGPNAPVEKVRRLVRLLLEDPTGWRARLALEAEELKALPQ